MASEQREVIRQIHGHTVPEGQCDGCPAGISYLCRECGLCQNHCQRNGCGYSPHASEAYDRDDDNC
jgi:hypothetical protein